MTEEQDFWKDVLLTAVRSNATFPVAVANSAVEALRDSFPEPDRSFEHSDVGGLGMAEPVSYDADCQTDEPEEESKVQKSEVPSMMWFPITIATVGLLVLLAWGWRQDPSTPASFTSKQMSPVIENLAAAKRWAEQSNVPLTALHCSERGDCTARSFFTRYSLNCKDDTCKITAIDANPPPPPNLFFIPNEEKEKEKK